VFVRAVVAGVQRAPEMLLMTCSDLPTAPAVSDVAEPARRKVLPERDWLDVPAGCGRSCVA
jgi:hypothetical protein